MSTQANTQLRNFKWSNLDALQRLLNDIGRHGHRDWPAKVSELRADLEFPRVKPKQNIALTFASGAGDDVAGYAIVEPEKNIGRSVIGIGTRVFGLTARKQLLDWAVIRAKQETPIAHLSTIANETEFEKLVEQMGWVKVRRYLKLATDSDLRQAPADIPKGFTLRTMLGLDEVSELTYLQNTAFKEHFGYSPNTEEEIRAHLLAPDAGVDDVVMIHDSNEQLVAYCWTGRYEGSGVFSGVKFGRIGMTGVLPAARNQGLGRAIAEAGFNHLLDRGSSELELDVDSLNAPAIKIYSSLGFKTTSKVNWWELSL